MPKYVLPEPEKSEEMEEGPITMGPMTERAYLPANQEILDALEMNQTVTVQLTGKVVGLESRQYEDETPRQEFQLEIASVETMTKSAMEEVFED